MFEKEKVKGSKVTEAESEENRSRNMLERNLPQDDDIIENNLIEEIIGSEEPKIIDNKSLASADELTKNLGKVTSILDDAMEDICDEINRDRDLITDVNVFAIVGEVKIGSPGYLEGLRKDDKLIQFGHLTASNFNNIRELETVSQASIFKPLPIKLKRGTEIITLEVTPRPWEKDGLVGCHVKIYPVQLHN